VIRDIHRHATIVDGNLHAEGRRILASGNPLAINLLHARRDELLHAVRQNLLGTRLAEPLDAVGERRLEELLLHIQEEVVETTEFTGLGSSTLLRIRVATLERKRELITGTILGVTDVDSHRIHGLGKTDLEILTVVLDGNRLATRLVHADIAKGDLVDVEVRDRDDRASSHCVLSMIYTILQTVNPFSHPT
jgi:hypothetical protein